MKQFYIGPSDEGQRLNKFCGRILKSAPQSFIYKMLRKKNIVLNGSKASGSEILKEGDELRIYLSDETFLKFADSSGFDAVTSEGPTHKNGYGGDSDYGCGNAVTRGTDSKRYGDIGGRSLSKSEIAYEDNNILVCIKPEGELSQKAKPSDVSINERIAVYLQGAQNDENPAAGHGAAKVFSSENGLQTGYGFVPGVCNRLDRNTTGLICAGKNLKSQRFLCSLFKNREIDKYYLATVKGEFIGKLDSVLYISKNGKSNVSAVSEKKTEGSSQIHSVFWGAVTGGGYSIVKVKLKTGKSHQIRAQLAYLGYPVVGDYKYGNGRDGNIRTQMLLAYELVFPKDCPDEFSNLSGKVIRCDIPDKFKEFWKEKNLWVHGKPEDLEVRF